MTRTNSNERRQHARIKTLLLENKRLKATVERLSDMLATATHDVLKEIKPHPLHQDSSLLYYEEES